MDRCLVTGAGGFIGGHLVRALRRNGFWVRAVDKQWTYPVEADEELTLDLRTKEACYNATLGVNRVFHLAADMGGIGYISSNHAGVFSSNAQIDLGMLEAARHRAVTKYFYASSACVYPVHIQNQQLLNLKESDAYPANPEPGYGWEKLFGEQLATYYYQDYKLPVYLGRFHNIYGPLGTYTGGREKAPAAICRKVIQAEDQIVIWGDGSQQRSYCYVSDCVDAILRLVETDYHEPVNIGDDRSISVDDLVELVERIEGKQLKRFYHREAPRGVQYRNCDYSILNRVTGWKPLTSLEVGLRTTYLWIKSELEKLNAGWHHRHG